MNRLRNPRARALLPREQDSGEAFGPPPPHLWAIVIGLMLAALAVLVAGLIVALA